MIVFAREVFVCKCNTVPVSPPSLGAASDNDGVTEQARRMQFVRGTQEDMERLPLEHHNAEHMADFKERLIRGEYWMIGYLDGKMVTYTWLHTRPVCDYPYLPGCSFHLAKDVGYGYDAWTPPELRGGGLRRRAFLEELEILHKLGMNWEASYFVKHQLEGATRSLGKVGIIVTPLWRVTLQANKRLKAEKLIADDSATSPNFESV